MKLNDAFVNKLPEYCWCYVCLIYPFEPYSTEGKYDEAVMGVLFIRHYDERVKCTATCCAMHRCKIPYPLHA